MNLDKKLAKYARQINNPKYYGKILDILTKAEKTGYEFKDFNVYDLEYLTGEILGYYEAVTSDEQDKRMIKYFNNDYFIISDKNYILFSSENFFVAFDVFIRAKLLILYAKIRQFLRPDVFIDIANAEKEIYFVRGGLKAANFLETSVFDLEEYRI